MRWTAEEGVNGTSHISFPHVRFLAALIVGLTLAAEPAMAQGTVRWTGATSTDWATAGNWAVVSGTPSTPPGPNDAVQIGTGAITNQPTIGSATTIASLTYGNAAASTLTINANLTVTGAVTNTIATTARVHNIDLSSGTIFSAATANLSPAVAAANMTITFNGGTFAVSGNFTAQPTTATTTITLTVGTGTFSVGGTTLQGAAANAQRNCDITVSTGTLNFSGAYTKNGSGSDLTSSGAASISFGGNVTNTRGTSFNLTGSTTTFTGSGTVTPTTAMTFGNVVVDNAAATTLGTGTVTVAGTLNASGALSIGGTTITVNGATTIDGTVALTSTTGTKTFVGLVDINPGGVWNNTGNEAIVFRGGLTHNGASFTSGTGTTTFNTNSQAINGSSPITFSGAVAVTGAITVTNNAAVSIVGNLTGSVAGSTWLNAANSTLNAGGAVLATGTLNAAATGNTVSYNGAGAQTIKATTYHHLVLDNASAKTAGGALTVNGDFTIAGSASFAAGSVTHDFAGNWIVNTTAATPLSVTTTSAINFNTPAIPAATSISGTTSAAIAFADLNANNTSGFNVNKNISFQTGTTPTLTVAAGVTLTPDPNIIISGATGTLTGSGTVKVTRTAAAPDFLTQYSINTKTLTNLSVDYDAGAAQTVNALNYSNLIVSGNRSGATVTLESGSVGISDSFSPNATNVTYAATGNTVNYNGTGVQSVAGFPYNDLMLSNTSNPVGAAANFDVAGTMTVNAGVTFSPDAAVVINNAGAQGTITGSGTVRVTRTAAVPDYLSQYKFSTHTLANLTVEYSSTGPQTVSAITYGNLAKSLSGAATLAGNVSVLGNLSVNGGTLDLAGFTADRSAAGGTLMLAAGATLRIGGTNGFPANYATRTLNAASTVEYYGSTQTISDETYGNLALTGSGPKSPPAGTTTTTVAGNFTLDYGIAYRPASGAAATLVLNGATNTSNGELGSVSDPFAAINVGNGVGDVLSSNGNLYTVNLAVTGSVVNGATAFVSGTLSGSGTFTQSVNSSLYIGGDATITTLAASANPNTVTYNGTGTQAVNGTTYHHLAVANGTGTATIASATTVDGNFTVSSGTASIGAAAVTVSGTTSVVGTLNITSATGVKTFNDLIVAGGGTFNNSGNSPVTISGNLENNGTFTAGTGVYTLSGPGKTISGSSDLTIPSISVSGSYTNTVTASLSITSALAGSGSFTNGAGALLKLGDPTILFAPAFTFTVATFNASSADNTVDYQRGGTMTIRVPNDGAYHHLKLSTSGAKTAGGGLTVNGDFTIQGLTTSFDAGASLSHTFYGNWIVNPTAGTAFSFTGSSTITFETPTPPATTGLSGAFTGTLAFNNLTINNGSGFQANLNLSASGTLTVAAGATLIPFESVIVSGTGTLTGSGTVKVTRTTATPDFLSQFTIANKDLSALTVDYDATNPQTVNALNYSHLIIRGVRGANSVTLESGTIGISQTLSPIATFTSGGYITTGNTVEFNGSGSQTIPAFNYNNLASSSTGARTLASSGTIGVAGSFTPGTNGYTITGSTIDYNGNGAQSVALFNYQNLVLSSSGAKTFAASTTRIAGNFTIVGAASADATTNSSTIEYNGSALQTTPSLTYTNLTVNNAGGVQLSGNATVNGTLTFGTGNISTGGNTLAIASTGSVFRTSGHVVGNLKKHVPAGSSSRTFEVGTGSNYTPAALDFVGVSVAGDLTVSTTGSDHPQILLSGIDPAKSVNRYWTVTNSGILFTTYDATFTFVPADVDAGADYNNFIVSRYSGGSWTPETVGAKSATSTQATGLTGFGDFQIGEPSAGVVKTWDGGASTNNWGDANNWNPDGVPTPSDNVSLSGAFTINVNIAATANSLTLNNGGLVLTILSGGSLTLSWDLSLTGGTLNTQTSFPTVSGSVNVTGGTVGYTAASGSQTVAPLSYYNLNLTGGGTRVFAAGTSAVAGALTVSGVTVDATTNASTIDFNGGGQVVPALNYYNLTVSNTGTKTFSSGTTGIANTFTISGLAAADAITNSSTIDYNGSGAQSIVPIDYHNLTLSNGGTKTFAAGTTKIAQDFVRTGSAMADAITNSSTIEFNGAGAQAFAAIDYYNITLATSGTKTLEAGTTRVANVFAVTGSAVADATTNATTVEYNGNIAQNVTKIDYHSLKLSVSGVKTFAGGTTKIAGDFTITGTASANVTTNSATIEYNGTAAQTTPVVDYVGLTINNNAGIDLVGDISVSGTLTFTTGNIRTGISKVRITSTGSVTRTSGHVDGSLEKYYPFSFGAISRTFEIGDQNNYTPVTVAFNNIFTAGYLIVSTTPGDHPEIVTSGIDPGKSVNRYYTLTNNGLPAATYSATFVFVSGDLDAGANWNNFIVRRYSSGSWSATTTGTRTATSTQVTGVTGWGEFQIGEPGTGSVKTWDGGAGTSNWGDANNWSPDGVPTLSDNVSLTTAVTLNVDVDAQVNSMTLNNSGLVLTILLGKSLTAAGDLLLTNGTLNTQAGFPSVAGAVTISGGTVGYTASSGSQTVAALAYHDLTISGGGTKSLAGSVTIAGNLLISGGSLDLGTYAANRSSAGGTLTLAASASLLLAGSNGGVAGSNFPANFTTLALSGLVEYDGAGAQTIAPVTYGVLTLSNSGLKTMSGAVTVQGNILVSAAANLTVDASGSLHVDGDFENDGIVTNNGTLIVGTE